MGLTRMLLPLMLCAAPLTVFAQSAKLSADFSRCMAAAGGADPQMRDCLSAEYERQDKRLNEVYKRAMAQQSPAQQKRLLEAQQRWIAYSDSNCQFYADPDRGTAARLRAHDCSVTARAARADELENIMAMGLNQPAEPPAKLNTAQRAQWFKTLKWPATCEERFRHTSAGGAYGGVDFYTLNPNQYLVRVECFGGAYNPGQLFMIYQPSPSHASRVVTLRGVGEDAKGEGASIAMGTALFDVKGKTLQIYRKSRGVGGCGVLVRYGFAANGDPNVIEARRRDECGNTPEAIDPNQWPKVNL